MVRSAGNELREAMAQGMVVAPGCYDALSARLIEKHGFRAVDVTGLGISLGYAGRPDMHLLTLTELATVSARMADSVDIPVIMDGEAGFGDVHSVGRAVHEFERAGVAAIHIEDAGEKRGLEKTGLIPIREMVAKIRAAKDAQQDPGFVLIARTDASIVSADEVVKRAKIYAEAGADVIFTVMHGAGILRNPVEARKMYEELPQRIKTPLMTNSPLGTDISAGAAESYGYAILAIPAVTVAAAGRAMDDALRALASAELPAHFEQFPPASLLELSELCGLSRMQALEERYYQDQ
ncbi:isocitrate lyase/PEP mutase family protein [Pseudonocardia sp. GCM10023141]|uniref:isocitrate lyase/PEP mutase family protein n=1 Tax=Pseudonocardia sp. GCM10023141 TaxID=3252653 RepID=UPI0036159CC8